MRTISSMILSWTSNIAQLFSVSIIISRLTVRLSAFSKEHLSFARSTPPSSSSAIFVMTYPWRHHQAFYTHRRHLTCRTPSAFCHTTTWLLRSRRSSDFCLEKFFYKEQCHLYGMGSVVFASEVMYVLSCFQAVRYRCWALGSYKYLHSRLFKICTTEPNYSNFMDILCSC